MEFLKSKWKRRAAEAALIGVTCLVGRAWAIGSDTQPKDPNASFAPDQLKTTSSPLARQNTFDPNTLTCQVHAAVGAKGLNVTVETNEPLPNGTHFEGTADYNHSGTHFNADAANGATIPNRADLDHITGRVLVTIGNTVVPVLCDQYTVPGKP